MARPKSTNPRTEYIRFTINEDELAQIEIGRKGVPRATFARDATLRESPTNLEEAKDAALKAIQRMVPFVKNKALAYGLLVELDKVK